MYVEHMSRQPTGQLEFVRRLDAQVEAQRRDAEDLGKRGFSFLGRAVGETPLELSQDRILGVAPHADDEGEAELRPIGIVELMEARELRVAQPVKSGAGLLTG